MQWNIPEVPATLVPEVKISGEAMDVGRYFGICMLLFIAMDLLLKSMQFIRWHFLLYGLQHFLTAIFLQSIVMPLWRHGRKKKTIFVGSGQSGLVRG